MTTRFVPGFHRLFYHVFKNRFLSGRPDGVRTSGAPFFSPISFCPYFSPFSFFGQILPFGHFFQRFVGLPWIDRTGRAHALTREPPPASPSSIFLGGKISHFFARSLRGLCHFCGPIFGNVFLALQSSRNPVSLANRSRKQRVSHKIHAP